MGEVEAALRESPRVRALVVAFAACGEDPDLTLRFLRDLLSHTELVAFANRWAVARALLGGETQGGAARRLGVSIKAVRDVARWARGPCATGGYAAVDRLLRPDR